MDTKLTDEVKANAEMAIGAFTTASNITYTDEEKRLIMLGVSLGFTGTIYALSRRGIIKAKFASTDNE